MDGIFLQDQMQKKNARGLHSPTAPTANGQPF